MLTHLVAPVDAEDHGHHPTLLLILWHQGRLLHTKDAADLVKLKLVGILLTHLKSRSNHLFEKLMTHPFLDELVPVEAREGLGRHNKLVPMGLDVIILRLR